MDWFDSLTDSASDIWGNFDVNQFIESAAEAYKTIKQAQGGTVQPTTRTLPDGSIARVDSSGRLTITSPTGSLLHSTAGAGAGGINTTTLVIGAAVLIGALVFLRR